MVRCENCGFLCLRKNTQELVETPQVTREKGELNRDGYEGTHERQPVCFVMAFSLKGEIKPDSGHAQEFKRIITADRDCTSWVQWQEGYTPKEHKEMVDQKALREWQQEQRRKDQARDDALRAEMRNWQERQALRQWGLSVVTALLSASVGAMLGYYLKK